MQKENFDNYELWKGFMNVSMRVEDLIIFSIMNSGHERKFKGRKS